MTLPVAVPAVPDDDARARRRRRQRLQMLAAIGGSYAVDVLLMLGLAAAGALPDAIPLLYGLSGFAICGAFYLAYSSRWVERFRDHYLVVPKVAVHAALNLAFVWVAPEIGLLLFMILFVILSFGALRMGRRQVVIGSLALSLAVGLFMALMGQQLALPMATPAQRLLCGLWFALVLVRSTGLGLYGSHVRVVLAQRNAQLAETSRKLEELATHDELTGALNRRCMMQLLNDERLRMLRSGQPFAVALLDIDHFKQINDGFGHQVGDAVLQRFSATMSGALRATDRFARHGGEEFLVLLTGVSDEATAMAVADRLRWTIEDREWGDLADGLDVTVSIGTAVCGAHEPVDRLLARADTALYEAKHGGRNCVRSS